ncbi:hypothetical protein BJP40_07350 [Streptomyces sp. CC53]|uniref:hypothetical protein n=1 Tax=unclassified Streptomyces TaxID=2593676 RepID=UPI0008DD7619|nr:MULTISPECIES: hypothetical protein [unclassified Streptomyces]OII61045.1 hypothetical protein BJP40_07350 [Streptomyces sp. CC53]
MASVQRRHAAPPPADDSEDLQVLQDVDLALHAASLRPTREAADALRERLRSVLLTHADRVATHARGLSDGRARGIALSVAAHARAVTADPVHDPAAHLRLLARGAQMLLRYTAALRAESA